MFPGVEWEDKHSRFSEYLFKMFMDKIDILQADAAGHGWDDARAKAIKSCVSLVCASSLEAGTVKGQWTLDSGHYGLVSAQSCANMSPTQRSWSPYHIIGVSV